MTVYKGREGVEKLRKKLKMKVASAVGEGLEIAGNRIIDGSAVGESEYPMRGNETFYNEPGDYKNSWAGSFTPSGDQARPDPSGTDARNTLDAVKNTLLGMQQLPDTLYFINHAEYAAQVNTEFTSAPANTGWERPKKSQYQFEFMIDFPLFLDGLEEGIRKNVKR